MDSRWKLSPHSGELLNRIYHLDGIDWFDRPRPRRWHRCEAVSRGVIGFDLVQRCACGAISIGRPTLWTERNSRK